MSTHRHIDRICVAVLVCTILLTVLFMNGARLGLQPVVNGDAAGSADSPYFTRNDRDGDWDATGATRIRLAGESAAVSGGGAYVYDGSVVIAQAGRYVLSGTLSDGSVVVDADSSAKVWLLLDGADISCADDAALRVEKADKVFLTLAADTDNRLTGGADYCEAAVEAGRGGAISARCDLTLNGSGSLTLRGAYRHGIDANDELVITGGSIQIDAAQDAVHVNDGLRIENAALCLRAGDEGVNVQGADSLLYLGGGSLTVTSAGDGLRCAGELLAEAGEITVDSGADGVDTGGAFRLAGGSLTLRAEDDGVNCAGGVSLDGGALEISAGDDGVHTDGDLRVRGVSLIAVSGGDGLHADGDIQIDGGALEISAGDDGLHADGAFRMEDGSLLVRACYEGIEALTIDIGGGEIALYPSDDGLNANGNSGFGFAPRSDSGADSAAVETWIHIRGGALTIVNENARDADGMDSNGDILISGGSIRISLNGSGSNNAIDYGSESGGVCVVSGGELVACGGSMMVESFSEESTQCAILYNLSSTAAAGTCVRLLDAQGRELLRYEPPCSFSSVALSAPGLLPGDSCTIVIGETETELTLEQTAVTLGSSGFGGGRPGGTDGRTPPEGSDMPQPPDFGGDWTPPEGSGMPQPPDFGGDWTPPEGSDLPQPPEREDAAQSDTRTEDAAQETADEALQPVPTPTWILLGACALVLLLGILFAGKYRVP